MRELKVVGDVPSCTVCGKPADIMIYREMDKDNINMFMLCHVDWQHFNEEVSSLKASIPEAFRKALDDQ